MKTIINYISIAILAIVCLYIVLAPWLSIIDISKSIDRVADRLDGLKAELKDIDTCMRTIARKMEDEE